MITFLSIVMLLLSAFLVMIVLVQRGRGGGLAGAFGSGGGSTSAFGTKTGDVFTTVTVVAFVLFMLLSIWLSFQIKWKSTNTLVIPTATKAPGGTTPPPVELPLLPESDKPKPATTQAATESAPALAPAIPTPTAATTTSRPATTQP